MAKAEAVKELIGLVVPSVDERVPCEAVLVRDGLAIHRSLKRRGRRARPYAISHVTSGLWLADYPSLAEAFMALGRLTAFLDWNGDQASVTTSEAHSTLGTFERHRFDSVP